MLDIPDELAPLSLEDDLKESAFAIYHRGVAKIQQEERRKFTETVQGILDDSNKTAHGKNKKAIEAIKDHAQWVFDEEKKLYRSICKKQSIRSGLMIWQRRKILAIGGVKPRH